MLAASLLGCGPASAVESFDCGVVAPKDQPALVTTRLAGVPALMAALERATKRPYAWTARSRLLAKRSDAIRHSAQIAAGDPPVALFLIHGADDQTVSPTATVDLYDALHPYYRRARAESRLGLKVVPGLSHSWGTADTDPRLEQAVAGWFNRFL